MRAPKVAWTGQAPAMKPGPGNDARGRRDRKENAIARHVILTALLAAAAVVGTAQAGTLDKVRERGSLVCGVSTGVNGFSSLDSNGVWQGFEVAFCRAVAAAVLGDPAALQIVPTTSAGRFRALARGEIDLLARSTTWTLSRDVGQGLAFAGISFFDAQGFMVRRESGLDSISGLDGATICVQIGATAEANLFDHFRAAGLSYTPVPVETNVAAQQQYLAGGCEAISAEASSLAAIRAALADPENHVLLPDPIAKEPLGPVVRKADTGWSDIVRWVLNALIAAEELGVTSANIEELARNAVNPEIRRLLGTEGDLGAFLGLDEEWAKRAIMAGGNYGEIFGATIGEATPIGLARGFNAQWTQGGLLYAPPFR